MKTRALVQNALITALMCILSVISFPVSEVPFSLGLIGVFICGIILTPKNAFITSLCYILIGVTGIPVFAGFKGGPGTLFGATGGFLFVYPIMAFLISFITGKFRNRKMLILYCALIVSLLLCYLSGTLWFSFVTGSSFKSSLVVSVYPFIAFDLIKIIICVIFCRFLKFLK